MSVISVSRKNWILKKYDNQEISFYKDNFFLDDITSKLLSIRKIKKDEVEKSSIILKKNRYPVVGFYWITRTRLEPGEIK